MCKFGNKMCSQVDAVAFFVDFFLILQFSAFTENWNFIFPKIVSATIFGLITHIIKLFRLCKFKKLNLKFVS